MLLGTIEGDIHDIGKNLVKMMFEGAGFRVIDLDIDVKAEKFLEEKKHPAVRAQNYSFLGVLHYSRNRLDLANCATERGFRLVGHAKAPDAFIDLLTTRATIQHSPTENKYNTLPKIPIPSVPDTSTRHHVIFAAFSILVVH